MFTEHQALESAVFRAGRSPCAKSKHGVVIWDRRVPYVLAEGVNSPPGPFTCTGSAECRAACNKICVHAEAAALLDLGEALGDTKHLEMLHVKVVDGKAVPSGPPSCWQCSRLILEAGLKVMWLLHEDGLRSYTPEEFHRLTLIQCGLPCSEVFRVGDIVTPVGDHQLYSGCERYEDAVVVRVEPFALCSRESDMLWECTVKMKNFAVTGRASDEMLAKCMRRIGSTLDLEAVGAAALASAEKEET